jgi:hypothetical protein
MGEKVSVIVRAMALFTDAVSDVDDEVIALLEGEIYASDGDRLFPTAIIFDFCDVYSINPSCHKGYTAVRFFGGESHTIKMSFCKAEELFFKSRGIENAKAIDFT